MRWPRLGYVPLNNADRNRILPSRALSSSRLGKVKFGLANSWSGQPFCEMANIRLRHLHLGLSVYCLNNIFYIFMVLNTSKSSINFELSKKNMWSSIFVTVWAFKEEQGSKQLHFSEKKMGIVFSNLLMAELCTLQRGSFYICFLETLTVITLLCQCTKKITEVSNEDLPILSLLWAGPIDRRTDIWWSRKVLEWRAYRVLNVEKSPTWWTDDL